MTTAEAAERLRCSAQAVREAAARGRLPGATKTGRDWFIPRTTVEALAAQRDEERVTA